MRLNNKMKIMVSAVTALLIFALLLSSACAGKPPAAEEKTVKVGHIAFSTGPVGDCGLPAVQMAGDMIRWINEGGGIDGVKIEFNWIDSGYEVPRSVAAYQRLKEWGAKVIWSFGTTPNDSIMSMAKEDGMPVVCWGGAAELFFPVKDSVFFATYESYDREGRAGIIWMMNNLSDLPKPPKVGLIHPDDAYGWSFANGALSYADTDGYEVAANTFADLGEAR